MRLLGIWELEISATADAELNALKADPSRRKQYKAVTKALGLLRKNPRHPGLNTHLWRSHECPHGDKLWEAYAENHTPGAYRIFFCYSPHAHRTICIIAITAASLTRRACHFARFRVAAIRFGADGSVRLAKNRAEPDAEPALATGT